jgi:hypothetical protein
MLLLKNQQKVFLPHKDVMNNLYDLMNKLNDIEIYDFTLNLKVSNIRVKKTNKSYGEIIFIENLRENK